MKNQNTPKKQGSLNVILAFIVSVSVLTAQNVHAQNVYKIASGSVKVSGTSTLHDWSMSASSFTCDAAVIVQNGQLQDISSLSFTLPVNNLKGKEDGMNDKAYKALNEEKFKTISFRLTEAAIVPGQKLLKVKGNLMIAGVTNEVSLQAEYVLNADETISFKASKALKMSDYKIKQISMMLGALKTGDEITVDLSLKLKKSVTDRTPKV